MPEIFRGAPRAHPFWPAPGCPDPATLPQIQLLPPTGSRLCAPRAIQAPPPTPESHSP